MPRLGSSPLGLIMDTGADSNIKLGSYVLNVDTGTGMDMYTSLFGREGRDGDGRSTVNFNYNEDKEDIFDISTQSIIDYCNNHAKMKLSYADFAYLRKLGVYPNNRLIIARRFASAVDDDLINTTNDSFPLATLVSWVPDNENFFDVSFNENWIDADTSFTDLLNDASSDRDLLAGDNAGKKLGTFLSEGASMIPLPGWSEGLQYEVFKRLGLTDLDATNLPTGNPNLIRMAKQRATAKKTGAFSGVESTIKVKMIVEYEQKFINKIDPTGVYYDIIANALTFGTSNSIFQFRSDALGANGEFANFLNDLGSGDSQRVKSALTLFATKLGQALQAVAEQLQKALSDLFNEQDEKNQANANNADNSEQKKQNPADRAASVIQKTLFGLLKTVIATLVSKYKVRILGILDALTGSPSAPWHVTIGNPKRPIFSSGDMLVRSVDVKFGKLLAYNDLPSTITVEVSMESARPLGAQEIFRKLNCGKARSYKRVRLDILSADNIVITQSDIDAFTFSNSPNLGQQNQSAANASTPLANNNPNSNAPAAGWQWLIANFDRVTAGITPSLAVGSASVPSSIVNRMNSQLLALQGTGSGTPSRPTTSPRPTNRVSSRTDRTSSDRGPNDVTEYANEKQAIVAYNSIINELEKVFSLQDSLGSDGGPILKSRLEPSTMASIIRTEVMTKLNSKVKVVNKWDLVKIQLDVALNEIYSALSSRTSLGPNNVSVPFFDRPTSRSYVQKTIKLPNRSISNLPGLAPGAPIASSTLPRVTGLVRVPGLFN
jgi:hypothetical protein